MASPSGFLLLRLEAGLPCTTADSALLLVHRGHSLGSPSSLYFLDGHWLSPELKPHTPSDPSSYLAGVICIISHEIASLPLESACVLPATTLLITCPPQDQVRPCSPQTAHSRSLNPNKSSQNAEQGCSTPLSSLPPSRLPQLFLPGTVNGPLLPSCSHSCSTLCVSLIEQLTSLHCVSSTRNLHPRAGPQTATITCAAQQRTRWKRMPALPHKTKGSNGAISKNY